MEPQIDGILLVDKATGESSYDVIRKAKKALGIKKIGHAGTLDPFATGLLILLIGQGTKLSRFIMGGRKTYIAKFKLGEETDTLDLTGKVIKQKEVPELMPSDIEQVAKEFIGDIEQMPPAYSAVKVKGKRAYEYARSGKSVALRPRRVTVFEMEVLNIELPFVDLEITCSSGTYIRSLACEFGKKLGTFAHVFSLKRTMSGQFSVDMAVKSAAIDPDGIGELRKRIIALTDALPDMERVAVSKELANKIRSGYQPVLSELDLPVAHGFDQERFFKVVCGTELVAIAGVKNGIGNKSNGILSIIRVFY